VEKQGRVLTSIGTCHNDNLPREVRDILNIELALGREGFINDREYNAHGLFCGGGCFKISLVKSFKNVGFTYYSFM